MGEAAITVEGLGKRYLLGEVDALRGARMLVASAVSRLRGRGMARDGGRDAIWALRDVSFEVRRGEVVGVIGANGAGKSTLLKILSRITRPTTGHARIDGRVGSLLEVGTGFHPELTGRENVFLNGAILGLKRAEIRARFDEIAAFSGVERFLDTPVKRYSSGMHTRLAFAVAAHLDPEILIVDEVLAVGDAMFQKRCLEKISEVSDAGRTVLLVSHRMDAIRRLCRTVILLEEGTLVFNGEPEAGIGKYLGDAGLNASLDDRGSDLGKPVHIRSAQLVGPQGLPCTVLSRGQPATVELLYEINRKVEGAYVFARLLNKDDVSIFATSDCDTGDALPRVRTPGIYTASFALPTGLLNEGDYSINFWIGMPFNITHDRVPSALRFHMHDPRTGGGPDHIRARGVIVQEIEWNTVRAP
ncbi:MAG: ABC transporter ATP-binding protein [Gammaproteobacteria bacterium]|nr:ABC transporter ATP-binding protein [Gammaproteobacteria bacterium]